MSVTQNSVDVFANQLRNWRNRRKLSQLELSAIAAVSAKHISFLEQRRSQPSREMVLKLGLAMDIPSIEINAALTMAGFNTAFPKAKLDDKNVEPLRAALNSMLEKHLPWPAFVCDQAWNLHNTNSAAKNLLEVLGVSEHSNVMQAMVSADDPAGPFTNWPEVAGLMLQRLDAEQLQRPEDTSLRNIRSHLRAHPRLQREPLDESQELNVVVPIKFRVNGEDLSLISMIAQFGAVQEITYSGLHIELFFPEDNATANYFKCL